MERQQLVQDLKQFKSYGYSVTVKLNSKTSTLVEEWNRLVDEHYNDQHNIGTTVVLEPQPQPQPQQLREDREYTQYEQPLEVKPASKMAQDYRNFLEQHKHGIMALILFTVSLFICIKELGTIAYENGRKMREHYEYWMPVLKWFYYHLVWQPMYVAIRF